MVISFINYQIQQVSLNKLFSMKQAIVIILASLLLVSCHHISGSGNIITEKRSPGNFTGLSVSTGIEVELKIGDNVEVTVEADDNVVKYVETRVKKGILRIRFEDGLSLSNTHVKVYVTAPAIDDLRASSAGSITVDDVLRSDGLLSFSVSSSGSITADLEAPEVKVSASSGSDIRLNGKTRDYTADASSGASVKTGGLLSERTTVSASSGATATVHASVNLDAKSSSGASIHYRGAANVQKTLNSGGSVTKAD